MDSPQSVVSPLKTTSLTEYEKQKTNLSVKSKEINFQEKKLIDSDDFIGVLEVYIHQARDIHNICIYQKQDVYAKLCLTTHPENTVSTKIINGGGRNPVFNENLSLDISKIDSSLKCEIWMLSRVKNYLEDQLLGFALVPVSEILLNNGKLQREFSLSSTDLFHSPAGFVDLSVSFVGATPEVIPISAPPSHDSVSESQLSELDKIEFPDPNIANENNHMVQEYLDNKMGSDDEKRVGPEQSPPSDCVLSTNVASSGPETQKKEIVSSHEEHSEEKSDDTTGNNPVVTVKVDAEVKVVQQEIVDMYMKSMQEFTESLAKMKLPMEFESGPSSRNSSSDQKSNESKKSSGSRVFYGSSAFF